MKISITTLLFLLFTIISSAQESRQQYVHADFRGRDCFGGMGLCSTQKTDLAGANASMTKNSDNTVTLKIFREKLTNEEEAHIFGQAISLANKNSLSFAQPESFQLSNDLKSKLEIAFSLDKIKAGTYLAEITKETISIRFSLQ